MEIINYKKLPIKENPHNVDVRILFKSENIQMLHITLKPGEFIPKHSVEFSSLFYVLEGTGIASIGHEDISVTNDSLVECPSNTLRGWRNSSDKPLRILVSKLPVDFIR